MKFSISLLAASAAAKVINVGIISDVHFNTDYNPYSS